MQQYSTLEVVPGPDYDKQVVPHPDYGKEVVPRLDYNKEVVQQQGGQLPQYVAGYDGLNLPIPRDEAAERKILGLRRRTFFIALCAVLAAVAIAVGVGVGFGMKRGSQSADSSAGGAAINTSSLDSTSTPIQRPPSSTSSSTSGSTSGSATSSVQSDTDPPRPPTTPTSPPFSTSPPSAVSTPKSTASAKVGGIGGRCSNRWGSDCICLEQGVCRDKWRGTPYTGYEGNWPCPDDPDEVMACVVKPCLGQADPAQCLWREACRELIPGVNAAPICPGGGDFVCCAHSW